MTSTEKNRLKRQRKADRKRKPGIEREAEQFEQLLAEATAIADAFELSREQDL